ncbi:MAG: NAD/NADP octopine/nopaline dehydrogenase family protein, partial [Acidimicrobiia bacterium]|nr:NAD/NADP octopine/nopaline dehydrogenase family protein [Acidimicrobiia bacterium]
QPDPEALLPGAVPLAATPLSSNLSEPLSRIIGQLAAERRTVAQRWGVRDLPPDPAWMTAALGQHIGPTPGLQGTAARRRVLEGTAGSLVPLASAAKIVDVDTPTTSAVIELVGAMFGFDLGVAGRRVAAMGLDRADVDQIRKAVSTAPRSN